MNRRLFIPSHQHLMAGHWHGVIILALTAYFILPSCQNQELPQDSVSKENLISMVAAEKNDEELGASGMHQGVHDEEDADYVDDEDDGSDHGGKAEGQHIHVYPVNLTEMFVRSFSSKKETPVVSLIEDQSDYRDCYACYRLREINGTGPKERVTIADTCFGGGAASMPTVRCYAHKPVLVYRNRSVAIVSGRATPSCAKSYIIESTKELTIRGCYSPSLTQTKNASRKLTAGTKRDVNTTAASSTNNNKNEINYSPDPYLIKFNRCRNGYGKETNKNTSVLLWCCDDNYCNTSGLSVRRMLMDAITTLPPLTAHLVLLRK